MRLIHVLVPDERREAVLDVLDDESIDYVRTDDLEGRDASLLEFPLPTQAVELVFERLRETGLEEEYVVVASAETARTRNFQELEERFVDGDEEDESIAHEEIRTKALDMTPSRHTYYAMTILSAVVATAGLLLDSPAIVVGSMVIAPQVGTALTAGVGTVINDPEMIKGGLLAQALGLGAAILAAAVFGWLLKSTDFVSSVLSVTTVTQISQRISPGALSLAVGICAGAAGAFGLATALPVSLVGVMIAAALIPAAAAVGIGLAWNLPAVVLGSFVMLVVNAVSINVAVVATLWYLGYRPSAWGDGASARRLLPAAVALVALLAALTGAGVAMTDQVAFENGVNEGVEATLETDDYRDLSLVSVHSEFAAISAVDREIEVTVVVHRPLEGDYSALPADLKRRIELRADRTVTVHVEYVDRASTERS